MFLLLKEKSPEGERGFHLSFPEGYTSRELPPWTLQLSTGPHGNLRVKGFSDFHVLGLDGADLKVHTLCIR